VSQEEKQEVSYPMAVAKYFLVTYWQLVFLAEGSH
jgi:hypothetical protein